jgi:hypothetical protein
LQNFFSGAPHAIFSKSARILTVIVIGHQQLNNTYCGPAGPTGPTGLLGILDLLDLLGLLGLLGLPVLLGLLGLPVLLGLLKFGTLVQIGLASQGA